MTDNFADDADFFGSDAVAAPGEAAAPAFSLDLTADDLSGQTEYKSIPVGTWLEVAAYEVLPGQASSAANYGKPNYRITVKTTATSAEWGNGRKFNIFCNLWGGAFFTMFDVLKATGLAPTAEMLKKGSFFSDAYMDQGFPVGLTTPGPDYIFTAAKQIPKGAFVMPSPKELTGQVFMAKVTHYSPGGGENKYKKYNSEEQALAANPLETRAFANLGAYMSLEEYAEKFGGAAKEDTTGGFLGK